MALLKTSSQGTWDPTTRVAVTSKTVGEDERHRRDAVGVFFFLCSADPGSWFGGPLPSCLCARSHVSSTLLGPPARKERDFISILGRGPWESRNSESCGTRSLADKQYDHFESPKSLYPPWLSSGSAGTFF